MKNWFTIVKEDYKECPEPFQLMAWAYLIVIVLDIALAWWVF